MPKERLLMLFIAVVAMALLLSVQNKAPEARATFRAIDVNITATVPSGNVTPPGPTEQPPSAGGPAGGGLPPAPKENVTNLTNVTQPPEELPPEEGATPTEQPKENVTGGVQRPKAAPQIITPEIAAGAAAASLLGYLIFVYAKRRKKKAPKKTVAGRKRERKEKHEENPAKKAKAEGKRKKV